MANLFHKIKSITLNTKSPAGISTGFISLLSIALCLFLLAGTTWSWFTENKTVMVEDTETASVELSEINIEKASATRAKVKLTEDNKNMDNMAAFHAEKNTKYEVSLNVKSTAQHSYLKVETGDGTFYTTVGETSKPLHFTLCISKDCKVTITACWGVPPENAVSFGNGDTLGKGILSEQPKENDEKHGNDAAKPSENKTEPTKPDAPIGGAATESGSGETDAPEPTAKPDHPSVEMGTDAVKPDQSE